MKIDSLNIDTYSELFNAFTELSNQPEGVGVVNYIFVLIGLLLAASKPIIKAIQRLTKIHKDTTVKVAKETAKEIVDGELDDFKLIIKDQVQASRDTIEVVKDSIDVVKDSVNIIKEDNAIRKNQHDEVMGIMNIHIEELTHVKSTVDDHGEKLVQHQDQIQSLKAIHEKKG